jgi:uncharacterized membrane protein
MSSERKGLIFSKGRLELLTDDVFAIIMTILVFNISVPELILFAEGEHTSERLSSRLLDLLHDILAYIVSFVTHSVYWVAHHRIFRWMVNVDRPLIWINISFLMTIGLIPFSTALVEQYMDQQISDPHRLYCLLSTRTVEATTRVLILEVAAIIFPSRYG